MRRLREKKKMKIQVLASKEKNRMVRERVGGMTYGVSKSTSYMKRKKNINEGEGVASLG